MLLSLNSDSSNMLCFEITIVSDSVTEENEVFFLNLSNEDFEVFIPVRVVSITILNDICMLMILSMLEKGDL